MTLLAHEVGFAEPCENLSIHLFNRMQAEGMDMIAGRKTLYFRQARVFQMASQNHVTNDPLSSQTDDSEAHSHLKRNPCFLRNNTHGTASSYQSRKRPKQVDREWSLSDEMLLQRIA